MKTIDAKEVIDCLPKDRTLYRYYKDAYAVNLLRRHIGANANTVKVGDIKKSRFGKLLEKSVVKRHIAQCGKGQLNAEALDQLHPAQQENYVLTLGLWGNDNAYGWQQVSRPGAN